MSAQSQTSRCDVTLTPSEIPNDLRNTAVVVMDVLRATTTIVYALQNGANAIIPCEEPEDALALRERLGNDGVVLGGERDSVRIPGFDLDNSPLSYTRDSIGGKTVVFTTTNGTRALRRAMHGSAAAILCGAFSNLSAVVEQLLQMDAASVLLACAGTEGKAALEDLLLAGAITTRLAAAIRNLQLNDAARTAILAFQCAAHDLPANLASSDHAQALTRAGFQDDILLAAQRDSATVVPIVRDGRIVASPSEGR